MPFFALLLGACAGPPDAPDTLEDLCAYLFAHVADEEDDHLLAGLDNLNRWLDDHLAETLDGYAVHSLDAEALDALDDRERDADGLVGAAVATESASSPERLAAALVLVDLDEVSPDAYVEYQRTFSRDPSCVLDGRCALVSSEVHAVSDWGFGITVTSDARGQHRGIETAAGWAMLQRSWLVGAADVSWDEIELNAQYYVQAILPRPDGAVRMQATWIDADYGVLPVSEDFALQQIVRSMQRMSEDLEEYVANH